MALSRSIRDAEVALRPYASQRLAPERPPRCACWPETCVAPGVYDARAGYAAVPVEPVQGSMRRKVATRPVHDPRSPVYGEREVVAVEDVTAGDEATYSGVLRRRGHTRGLPLSPSQLGSRSSQIHGIRKRDDAGPTRP